MAEGVADDMIFMEIPSVFAASRREEKVELAASNITVITADQIKAWGFRDLKDVLRVVPGYNVLFDRDEWVLSSRGLTSDNTTKFTLAIDGNIVNLLSGFGISNLMDLPNDLSFVKQIEVIRGPGSISWGNNASAGVINIVTKSAADLKKPQNVQAKVGSESTYVQSFQFGQTRDADVDLTFNGTIAQSKGRRINLDSSTTNPIRDVPIPQVPGSGNGSRGRFTTALDRIAPSYRFQGKAAIGNLKLNGYSFSNRNYNRQYEVGRGREFWISREQSYVSGEWNGKVLNEKLDLTFRMLGGTGQQTYDTEISTTPPAGVSTPNHTITQDRRTLSSSLEGAMSFLDEKLRFTVGVDNVEKRFAVSQVNATNFSVVNTAGTNTGGFVRFNKSDSTIGIYESLTLSPTPSLHFVAGMRSDHNDDRGTDDNKWLHSPRAAVMWEPSNTNVLKLIYNSGFLRADANQQASLPTLEPEEISQLDLIFIQKIGRMNLTTTLFNQKAKKVLFLGEGSVATANTINGQDETSRGVEVELTGMIGAHRLFVGGSMFENKADSYPALSVMVIDNRRFDEKDNKLAAFTRTANAGVSLAVAPSLSVSPMVRFVAPIKYRQTSVPTGSGVEVADYRKTDPIYYLDLNVNWDINDAFSLGVYGNNLGNEREELPHAVRNGSYQPYGRYVEGKVSMHW